MRQMLVLLATCCIMTEFSRVYAEASVESQTSGQTGKAVSEKNAYIPRYATIDLNRAMAESKEGQEIQKALQREAEKLFQDVQKRRNNLEKDKEKLRQEAENVKKLREDHKGSYDDTATSEERASDATATHTIRERERKMKEEGDRLAWEERYIEEDAKEVQKTLQAREREKTAQLQEHVYAATNKVTEREGYDGIVAKMPGFRVSPAADITDMVIKEMNRAYKFTGSGKKEGASSSGTKAAPQNDTPKETASGVRDADGGKAVEKNGKPEK